MSGYNPQEQSQSTPVTPRSKILIIILGIIAVACVGQFIFMVMRLANISDFPSEQWGIIQLSTNMQIIISIFGLVCLYGTWNRDRKLTYGFYGVAVLNIAFSLYANQPLLVLASVVAVVLHLFARRYT